MSAYEMKKLQVEYKRVNAAKEEQELRVFELEEQINRVKNSIEISKTKEDEILAKIADLQKAQS